MSDHDQEERTETADPVGTQATTSAWERRIGPIVAALFLGLAAGYAWWFYLAPRDLIIPDRTLTQEEVHEVLRIINASIIHEDAAEDFVQQFGADALNILVPVLRDHREQPFKRGRVAYLIGKYRDPAYTQDIVDVIEQTLQPNMGGSGLAAVAYAIEGLGWAGDERAIRALKTLAGQAFWDQREPIPHKLEPDDAPRIQLLLRERAVRALGEAPDGAGIEALKQLAQAHPVLSEPIDDALSHARRARWGLAD